MKPCGGIDKECEPIATMKMLVLTKKCEPIVVWKASSLWGRGGLIFRVFRVIHQKKANRLNSYVKNPSIFFYLIGNLCSIGSISSQNLFQVGLKHRISRLSVQRGQKKIGSQNAFLLGEKCAIIVNYPTP